MLELVHRGPDFVQFLPQSDNSNPIHSCEMLLLEIYVVKFWISSVSSSMSQICPAKDKKFVERFNLGVSRYKEDNVK